MAGPRRLVSLETRSLVLNTVVMIGFPTDFVDQPPPTLGLWRGNRQLFLGR